jgi:hypothetical protein
MAFVILLSKRMPTAVAANDAVTVFGASITILNGFAEPAAEPLQAVKMYPA